MSRLFHCLGLGCLVGAVFLEGYVFFSILANGYFRATEDSKLILLFEIVMTLFGLVYLLYICTKLLT